MSDSFTTVTNQGYFSRIGKSIVGIFIGAIMALIAVVVLFWNEGRAVKRAKTLNKG